MSNQSHRQVSLLQSPFFKCNVMVALCVIAVVVVIGARSYANASLGVAVGLAERAEEVSRSLDMQLGGSVKEVSDGSQAIATGLREQPSGLAEVN